MTYVADRGKFKFKRLQSRITTPNSNFSNFLAFVFPRISSKCGPVWKEPTVGVFFLFIALRLIPGRLLAGVWRGGRGGRETEGGSVLNRNVGIQKGNYELLKFNTSHGADGFGLVFRRSKTGSVGLYGATRAMRMGLVFRRVFAEWICWPGIVLQVSICVLAE